MIVSLTRGCRENGAPSSSSARIKPARTLSQDSGLTSTCNAVSSASQLHHREVGTCHTAKKIRGLPVLWAREETPSFASTDDAWPAIDTTWLTEDDSRPVLPPPLIVLLLPVMAMVLVVLIAVSGPVSVKLPVMLMVVAVPALTAAIAVLSEAVSLALTVWAWAGAMPPARRIGVRQVVASRTAAKRPASGALQASCVSPKRTARSA